MDLVAEAKKRWALTPVNPLVLEETQVLGELKQFFLNVGCANFSSDELSLFGSPQFSSLGIEIGRDYATTFVVDSTSGQVNSVDATGESQTRLMNSSYAALLVCVSLYDEALKTLQSGQYAMDGVNGVAEFERQLNVADPSALQLTESYWNVIVAALREGLM